MVHSIMLAVLRGFREGVRKHRDLERAIGHLPAQTCSPHTFLFWKGNEKPCRRAFLHVPLDSSCNLPAHPLADIWNRGLHPLYDDWRGRPCRLRAWGDCKRVAINLHGKKENPESIQVGRGRLCNGSTAFEIVLPPYIQFRCQISFM